MRGTVLGPSGPKIMEAGAGARETGSGESQWSRWEVELLKAMGIGMDRKG